MRFQWMRALFPSWRFFDKAETELALWYREKSPSLGGWKNALPKRAPKWSLLFFFYDPQTALRLALKSLLEQSVEQNDEPSYEHLWNWVRWASDGKGVQFKVVEIDLATGATEDLLVSSEAHDG